MTKATKSHTKTWLLGTMGRMVPSGGVNDAKAAAELAAPSFMARFPAEAMCAEAQDHVVMTERFWSEAAVAKALGDWWDKHQPAGNGMPPEALAYPGPDEAKHWIACFVRAIGDSEATRALDLIRSKDTAAFAYLLRTNDVAASIAVRNRWRPPRTPADLQAEWDDPIGILSCVAKLRARPPMWRGLLELLRAAVTAHAAHHARLVPTAEALINGDDLPVAAVPASVMFGAADP